MTRRSRPLRTVSLLTGAVAIAYGFTLPASGSDGQWLLCLFAGGLFVALGAWPRRSRHSAPEASALNVCATLLLVFGLLGVQATRLQVVRSEDVSARTAPEPDGDEVVSNPRNVDADLRIARGRIVDRNGVVLADTRIRADRVQRRYPEPNASYVCGYFSPLKYGKSGLEAVYDDELTGRDRRDALAETVDALLQRQPAGLDLSLTLDVDLQNQAHELLGDQIGSVVVVDVETGAVLVLASNPHHDPAALAAVDSASSEAATLAWTDYLADPARPLVLRATDGRYTPGSTFKVVTAAAALDAGLASPDDVYEDDGDLEVEGHVIVEANRPDNAVNTWTLREGLAYSLNVVFAQVGLQLGADRLLDYAERFGFGDAIPFDLPVAAGQVAGSADFLERLPALADTAFGQGELLTTPLGMAMVAATVANDGEMPRPFLVASMQAQGGETVWAAEPSIASRPIAASPAEQVRDMMVYAVENGYATNAAIEGLVVGGKTGTAETGGEEPHAWFIGFAGREQPEYAIAVLLEHGGSGTDRPVAIARDMLQATMAESSANP